jgi:hypothetical protein
VAFVSDAGRLDETHHPLAMTPPRLEQLEHAVVVDAAPDERGAHPLADVEVADAHGIRISV